MGFHSNTQIRPKKPLRLYLSVSDSLLLSHTVAATTPSPPPPLRSSDRRHDPLSLSLRHEDRRHYPLSLPPRRSHHSDRHHYHKVRILDLELILDFWAPKFKFGVSDFKDDFCEIDWFWLLIELD